MSVTIDFSFYWFLIGFHYTGNPYKYGLFLTHPAQPGRAICLFVFLQTSGCM